MVGSKYHDSFKDDEDRHVKGVIEAESVRSFKLKVFKEFLTFNDAREILMINASSQKIMDIWEPRLDALEDKAKKVRVRLMKKDKKGIGWRHKEFFDFRKARRLFVNEMRREFNKRVNSIHDIGRMAVYNDEDILYQRFYDFNPESLVYPFLKAKEGILASVSGNMGSGKTDFSLFLAELLLDTEKVKFNILTNIPIMEMERLHVCRNMGDLVKKLIHLSREAESMPTVVIMDETSQFFSRREPGKKSNIQLEKFLRLIRKFNASIIFIDQLKDGLPGAALSLRTVLYHKTAKKKLHYSTRLDGRNYNNYLSDIPRTKLEFDTKHMGGFIYNVNLGALFDEVLLADDQGDALLKAIENQLRKKETTTEDRILKFIKKNPGCIQRDIANFLDLSDEAIRKQVIKLKKIGKLKIETYGHSNRLYIDST